MVKYCRCTNIISPMNSSGQCRILLYLWTLGNNVGNYHELRFCSPVILGIGVECMEGDDL